MTMAEFITLALQDELHPKQNITEVKTMGKHEDAGISGTGGTFSADQGLFAAQQYDAEGVRYRVDRERN